MLYANGCWRRRTWASRRPSRLQLLWRSQRMTPRPLALEQGPRVHCGGCSSNNDETEADIEGLAKITRTGCRRRMLPVWKDRTLTTSMPLSRFCLSRRRKNGPHSSSLQSNKESNKRDESAQNDLTSRRWINWTLSTRPPPAQCPLTG